MGKIQKEPSSKHEASKPPVISEYIKACLSSPLYRLPSHLDSLPKRWPFPRGDLHHWIAVLNRFDDILATFSKEYGLSEGPQVVRFSNQMLLRGQDGEVKTGKGAGTTVETLESFGFSSEGDRELVEKVLDITRRLFENCSNRSLYASSERLNDLLNTTSLSLLEVTLRLGHRLSQRYAAARARYSPPHLSHIKYDLLAAHYQLDLNRVETIAMPFLKSSSVVRDGHSERAETSDGTKNEAEAPDFLLMVRGGNMNDSQWKKISQDIWDSVASTSTPSQGKPTSTEKDRSGSSSIRRRSSAGPADSLPMALATSPDAMGESAPYEPNSFEKLENTPAIDMMRDIPSNSTVQDKYAFLQRVRVGKAFLDNIETRRQIVGIRVLAIANLANIYPEQMLQQNIMAQDLKESRRYQLPYQLCDLIHPPGDSAAQIPKKLQTFALICLEGLTNHKSKSAEVCTALSVNVNHGVLAYVIRKAVSELAVSNTDATATEDLEWREALFALLYALPKCSSRAAEGFASAGLLHLFVVALKMRTPKAELDHPRVLNFLDVIVYNSRDSFNVLVNAKGLDAISDLLSDEVKKSVSLVEQSHGLQDSFKSQSTDYRIPFVHHQTLRALFKFVSHMMQMNGGTVDRSLRNLIESSELLASLQSIISNPTMFGSTVWSGTITVVSLFIHNEPTSYAAIAEAGITKTFLETITQRSIPAQGPADERNESPGDVIERLVESGVSERDLQSQQKAWNDASDKLSRGILPAHETITAISHVFSAICLNDSGMEQVVQSKALRFFLWMFLCPPHARALSQAPGKEIENLGAAFDELARHYPRLKQEIISIVAKTASSISKVAHIRASRQFIGPKLWAIDELGQEIVDGGRNALVSDPGSITSATNNVIDFGSNGDADVEMSDVQHEPSPRTSPDAVTARDVLSNEPPNFFLTIADHVSIFSKFLMGFFSNPSLVLPFSETEGIERVLDIVTAPSLPFDFTDQNPQTNLVSVIQILVEQKPHLTLPSLISRAQNALESLAPFLDHTSDESFFETFVQTSEQSSKTSGKTRNLGTSAVKAMSVVQILCVILSKSHTPPNNRAGSTVLSAVNLTDMYNRLIDNLGRLMGRCVWESTLMKEAVPELFKNPQLTLRPNSHPSAIVANGTMAGSGNQASQTPVISSSGENANATSVEPVHTGAQQNGTSAKSVQMERTTEEKNFVQVRYIVNHLPTTIAQLFHAIGKSVPRRLPTDAYQKQSLLIIADHIAQALVDPLSGSLSSSIDERSVQHFRSICVSIMTQTMIDNRAEPMDRPGPQVLTLTLRAFKNKQGLVLLSEVFKALFKASAELQEEADRDDDARERQAFIIDGMRNILEFFAQITSHKIVLDAHQTNALTSRPDRDMDKPDYFNPQQFLVEIRMAVLQGIRPLWQSDSLESSKPAIVRRITHIIQNVLESQGENGAFKKSQKIPPKVPAVHKKWRVPNSETMTFMRDKGYSESLIREALYRCNGNREAALEYCAAYRRDPQLPRHPIPSYDETSEPQEESSQPSVAQSRNTSQPLSSFSTAQPPNIERISSLREDITQLNNASPGNPQDIRRLFDALVAQEATERDGAPLGGFEFGDEPLDEIQSTPANDTNGTKAEELSDVLTIEDLDDMRSEVRQGIVDRCLTILNAFDSLTFDLASLIISAVSKASDQKSLREDVSGTLVQSLISYQGTETLQENSKKIAATAHLLGIILQDNAFFEAAKDELKDSFPSLLSFLVVPAESSSESSIIWIAQIMLVIERILAEDAQPHQIKWDHEHQQQAQPAHLAEPLVPLEDKQTLFDQIMALLPHVGKNSALGLAIARLLVIVTRNRNIASRLGQKKYMQRLLLMAKQMTSVMDDKFRSAFMSILRHVVEDEDTVRQIMKSEIRDFFEKQSRAVDISNFLQRMPHLPLRQPEIFVEAVNELLELQRFDRSQPHNLRLKKEQTIPEGEEALAQVQPSENAIGMSDLEPIQTSMTNESAVEKSKSSEIKTPTVENPDGVIHYLLSELLSYKDVDDVEAPAIKKTGIKSNQEDVDMTLEDPRPSTSQPSDELQGSRDTENKPQFKAEEHPIFAYRCFLLQSLTELLQSYNRTKVEFINFSRKSDPQAATPSKPRSGVLNYILNALVPTGSVEHPSDIHSKKKGSTSFWAINVIVALCTRTNEKRTSPRRSATDEDDPDLSFVRRFVLEHALKAYKDANNSSEAFVPKYSKLLSFADLFDRMLAGKPGEAAYHRRHEAQNDDNLVPSQKQLARIMFEKNFIAALTSSMADVDLTVSGAQRVVKYILRPLKLLTHTAIELSLSSDYSTSAGQTEDDEISSATSISDSVEGREETPDLFRNSTLGMFEPGREEESSSSSEEEVDEADVIYGDDYADDMEFDEDDGEDDEVVSDEEDIDMDGPMEGLPGDVGMEVEIDLTGEDEDTDEDDEGDDEDEDDSMDSDSDPDHDADVDDEIEIMEEVTGDDENDSLAEDEEGEWQDDEDDDVDDGIRYEDVDDPEVALDMTVGDNFDPGLHHEDSLSEDAGLDYQDPDMEEPVDDDDEMALEVDQDGQIHEDSDPEDDEDEDDYDDEGIMYGDREIGDEEADMPPFIFGWPHTPNRHSHHRHHWPGLQRTGRWMVPGGYRSHRPAGTTRGNEDGVNPLLNRGLQQSAADGFPARSNFSLGDRAGMFGNIWSQGGGSLPPFGRHVGNRLAQAISGLGGNHLSTLNEIMSFLSPPTQFASLPGLQQLSGHGHHHHHHHHPGALHFTIPYGSPIPRGLEDLMQLGGPNPSHTGRPDRHDPAQSIHFMPAATTERWQEETRLIFGNTMTERSLRVTNSILKFLVPPAQEAEKIRKQKALEKAKKEEEERARVQAEREERERKEREEREAREAAEREAAAAEAERAAAIRAEQGDQGATEGDAMEGVETSDDQQTGQDEAQPTEPRPRVYANLRGQQVDITDLGIDNAYLEALPEDMRTEVIMMQFATQRSEAAAAGEEPSSINREFLDALPQEIREEVLAQEAQDRRRRDREEARRRAAADGNPVRAEEMDPASFMASLDPVLRQSVLAEADEDTIAQLPPEIAAEARALGVHQRRRAMDPSRAMRAGEVDDILHGRRRFGEDSSRAVGDQRVHRRPIVQMLDKTAIATLLRLMFVSIHGNSRQSLNGILRNACGNHQTRGDIVSGLLSILQDGTMDSSSVERSFAQFTARARQSASGKSSQTKKTQADQALAKSEISPMSVTSHCLSALGFLTQSIAHLPKFFVTEHEIVLGSKSKANRKGKGKENKTNKYPINSLLSLLDRQAIVNNSTVMEQLALLLQIVTQPLIALVKKDKDEGPGETEGEAADSTTAVPLAQVESQTLPDAGNTTSEALAERNEEAAEPNSTAESAPAQVLVEASTDVQAESKPAENKAAESKKPLEPPEIPEENLRLVVNILTARDCSSKTFRDTLSTINNLSAVPLAREVFGQELVRRARELGQTIQANLTQLIQALQGVVDEMEAQSLALTNFSPAGSDQAKLNRILTALDYLFDHKPSDNKTKQQEGPDQLGEDLLTALYDDRSFAMLWQQLSACLSATQQDEHYFFNVATILLPLIEALMVVCKRLSLDDSKGGKGSQSVTASPVPESPSISNVFFTFTNRHKKILNDLVRHNPKLMSGSFSVLVKNSNVLEFDNKRNYFNRRLHHRSAEHRHYPHPSLQLNIRRDQVFIDSYQALCFKKAEEIKYGKFNIRFHNEEGVDAGGVTREWFQVLSRQMFDPSYALFNPVASDRTTFHPNSLSGINDNHLHYFKFIGRIIGKALYENRVLDCHFSRAVYKRILGKQVTMKDMETLDLEFTNSLQWMLDNDITDIITETFSVEKENFGATEVIDLVENGRNIPVTEENKHEYARLLVEYRLTGSVQEQLESFLGGFHDIVPADLIRIFDEGELELLISGMPDVDIDDWKNNTEYHNYNASSPQIQWFWRAVRSFDKEERAKLLQFVTGTGKVPLNGFKELEGMNGFTRFSIHKDYTDKERLPSSHTCFNQLDLPEYENYEQLRKQLYTAMTTGNEFFGFA